MKKPSYIELIRSDMSNWLIHFTQYNPDSAQDNEYPFGVLREIIYEGKLKGSSKRIKGGYTCVCFSEAPLTKAISLIKYEESQGSLRKIRYAPFGVAVRKEWLFQQGGRPVIYQL